MEPITSASLSISSPSLVDLTAFDRCNAAGRGLLDDLAAAVLGHPMQFAKLVLAIVARQVGEVLRQQRDSFRPPTVILHELEQQVARTFRLSSPSSFRPATVNQDCGRPRNYSNRWHGLSALRAHRRTRSVTTPSPFSLQTRISISTWRR